MVLFKEDEADSISKDFGNTSELWLPPQVYFQEQNQGGLFFFFQEQASSLAVPSCKSSFGATSFSWAQADGAGGKQLGDSGSLMMPGLA